MIFDNPMMFINLWFYKQWTFHKNVWRIYAVLGLTSFLNFGQISDLLFERASVETKIRNAFIVTLWFNAVLRGWIFHFRKSNYVRFLQKIEDFSQDIRFRYRDPGMIQILDETTYFAKRWNVLNLAFGIFTCIAFNCAPIFSDVKELPYGFYLPGLKKFETPYFQILYVLMMSVTLLGCHIYIPLSNLFVISMMFGTTMCRILQFRMRSLHLSQQTEKSLMNQIVWCISYQLNLIKYIKEFNELISILFLVEFAMYGVILCALLFLIATLSITDIANVVIVAVYIVTMLSQISAFAWFANELYDESLEVGNAAYGCYWYNYSIQVKQTIKLLILRSQKPLAIRMGNIYDMNLQSLQSLLNVTYTTFTLLKRVYRPR